MIIAPIDQKNQKRRGAIASTATAIASGK